MGEGEGDPTTGDVVPVRGAGPGTTNRTTVTPIAPTGGERTGGLTVVPVLSKCAPVTTGAPGGGDVSRDV